MKTLRLLAVSTVVFAAASTAAIAAYAATPAAAPQPNAPAKPVSSPEATANVTLNGKSVMVKYNSPRMRGRKVMGELVPYGKVWRTGANPATSFVTATDLMIGNLKVPAGSYTLFTLPAAPGTPWLLIVSKETGQWGLDYHEAQDLGRTPLQAGKLSSAQENMSITFENTKGNSTELHIKWENTDQWVRVRAQ